VDWTTLLTASGGQVGTVVGGATAPQAKDELDQPEMQDGGENTDQEPAFLTVGLIGQPNVGKSSLLNALFGIPKVKASRTPGKTKHFQTLFWTPEVRLVDCPGLVMPNITPMETQVMCGILPISRVSAVPLCIHYAARFLPLEEIWDLKHPSLEADRVEDKRTWREPRTNTDVEKQTKLDWTAMDILTAFALKKGWVTAKAGRPDVNRAGNYILRALAEGKVFWGFWPPDTPVATVESHQVTGNGIWIPSTDGIRDEDDFDGDSDEEVKTDIDSDEEHPDDDDEDEGEDEELEMKLSSIGSRFGALVAMEGEEDEEDDSDHEEGQ